jgi:flagellar basal-body rod protein FlgB
MINRLTDGLEFHARALVLRAERQRVLAGNIANADTPGYQARDFDFAAELRSATAGLRGTGGAGSASTSPPGENILRGGVGALGSADRSGVDGRHLPTLLYARPSMTSADGNTVDMDRERAAFVDNSVNYEATVRFVNGSVRTLLEAMRAPGQG